MFSPSRHHHQPWRSRALSPYATAVSRRQSWAACVTVRVPFTAFSLWHDHNPIHCNLLAQGKSLIRGPSPEHERCSWEKDTRKRFLCGETSTAPAQRRPWVLSVFVFFISVTLMIYMYVTYTFVCVLRHIYPFFLAVDIQHFFFFFVFFLSFLSFSVSPSLFLFRSFCPFVF